MNDKCKSCIYYEVYDIDDESISSCDKGNVIDEYVDCTDYVRNVMYGAD